MPEWARIIDGVKYMKCVKCAGWCSLVDMHIMKCISCNFKAYERKLESYWVKKEAEINRHKKLEELGMTPTETYYCTKCRVNHIAGTQIGFNHLEFAGEKNRISVCVVPDCNTLLTGRQKKYCTECSKPNATWRTKCKECGYDFGLRGDGYATRQICYGCSEKERGAILSDWDLFDSNPTESFKEIELKFIQLAKAGEITDEHKNAYSRINEFYGD